MLSQTTTNDDFHGDISCLVWAKEEVMLARIATPASGHSNLFILLYV